jgi:hypothetical protein
METIPRLSERTPLDWRSLLIGQLAVQQEWCQVFEAYYDGNHPLQFATSKFREAFGNLFGAFADNWCQIVVDSSVERLEIVGFSIGGSASDQAWALWQANALTVESVIAHTEAGKCGRCYLLVDPNGDEGPRITVEHPEQMVVANDPGDRRKRLAALKRWEGDDRHHYVTLYLPDQVFKWESAEPVHQAGGPIEWVERSDDLHESSNPLGVVPAIPLENNPGLLGRPHSDLDSAIPLQNAVNKICTDMIVSSEYGAFPQRVLTGVDVPKDPETGQPIKDDEMKAAMSRLWTFKSPDVSAIQLPAADMNNFVVSIEMLIQHLAAQTRTPPHYLLAKMVNLSGDALATAEAGLVEKCEKKILFFSDPWEEAMALALTAAGTDTLPADVESIWKNPERISQAQLTDASVKKKVSLDVPVEQIWLELGYTPEKIKEMAKVLEGKEEAALAAAALAQEAAVRESVAVGTPPGEPAPPGTQPPAPQGPNPGPPAPPTTGGRP